MKLSDLYEGDFFRVPNFHSNQRVFVKKGGDKYHRYRYVAIDNYDICHTDENLDVIKTDKDGNDIKEKFNIKWQYVDGACRKHDEWVRVKFNSYYEVFTYLKEVINKESRDMIRWDWDDE